MKRRLAVCAIRINTLATSSRAQLSSIITNNLKNNNNNKRTNIVNKVIRLNNIKPLIILTAVQIQTSR